MNRDVEKFSVVTNTGTNLLLLEIMSRFQCPQCSWVKLVTGLLTLDAPFYLISCRSFFPQPFRGSPGIGLLYCPRLLIRRVFPLNLQLTIISTRKSHYLQPVDAVSSPALTLLLYQLLCSRKPRVSSGILTWSDLGRQI